MKTSLMRFSAVFAAAVLASTTAQAVVDAFDDFTDGNDTLNPTWLHHSGLVGSSGQSWTVSGGTYRLQAPNNSPVPGLQNYGYVGSIVGSVNTGVHVEVDFLDWAEPTPGMGGVFGVGARWTTTGGLNNLQGYGYAYEPFAAGLTGEMVLYRFNGVNITDIGSQQVDLDPNKSYRFVFDITGTLLHGSVFEIGGGMVADKYAVDATYASGRSSVFGYSAGGLGLPPTDFTVDNMIVTVPEPGSCLIFGIGGLMLAVSRRRSN